MRNEKLRATHSHLIIKILHFVQNDITFSVISTEGRELNNLAFSIYNLAFGIISIFGVTYGYCFY